MLDIITVIFLFIYYIIQKKTLILTYIFDVKNHSKFINKANQTSSSFDTTGIIPWNKGLKGKTHSEKQKKKWSETRKGTRKGLENSFYGRTHSDESKKKISESWQHGDAELRRVRISNKIKPYKCIQIFNAEDKLMYEIENSFKKTCESLKLPYESLRKSFAQNGAKLYQGRKKKKQDEPFFEFVGWYAKKVE